MRALICLLSLSLLSISTLSAQEVVRRPGCHCYTPEMIMMMEEHQLLDIYRHATPGRIPAGYYPGSMIRTPGSPFTVALAGSVKATAWQGKFFSAEGMTNKTFGVKTIKTPVEYGTSYVDGKPTIVLDYAMSTAIFAKAYRDEIREISPAVFLGIMHKREDTGTKISAWFVLDGRPKK